LDVLKSLSTVQKKKDFSNLCGQKQWSILSEIPDFDMVLGQNFEFMHSFLYSVVGYLSAALFGPAKSIPTYCENNLHQVSYSIDLLRYFPYVHLLIIIFYLG
jgi:hypothetical protein